MPQSALDVTGKVYISTVGNAWHVGGMIMPVSTDIFDAIDKHGDRIRTCPVCGEDDVKFGTHDPEYEGTRGYTTHAECCNPQCRHLEMSNDAEALYLAWTRGP